jgi:hypothetical protein
MGSAAFFIPLMAMVPLRRRPPWMNSFSMILYSATGAKALTTRKWRMEG